MGHILIFKEIFTKPNIMKTHVTITLIVLTSLFLLPSCNDLLDVTRSFTFEHEFHVTSSDQVFQENVLIDMAMEESLIADYGSKIKKIEIEEVRCWLTSQLGPENQQYNELILNIANDDGSDIKNIFNLQNLVLSELLNNPTALEINAQGIQKLSEKIKTPPHKFSFQLSGNVNETPVNFRMVVELKIKMTANPL
jgi:hypothetical protein